MPSALILDFNSSVTWQDSGGSEALTLQNLGAAAGRNGAIHDWGAAPRTGWYLCEIDLTAGWETAPTVGGLVKAYVRGAGIASSAGTVGNDDGGNVALSSVDKLLNLDPICVAKADENAADIPTVGRAVFFCAERHFGITVFNGASTALQNTANTSIIRVTPFFNEAQ